MNDSALPSHLVTSQSRCPPVHQRQTGYKWMNEWRGMWVRYWWRIITEKKHNCPKDKHLEEVLTMKFYLHSESAFFWMVVFMMRSNKIDSKLMVSATLDYNKPTSASMSTRGRRQCTHLVLPNAFVPPKDTIHDHIYIWAPSTTGACLWQWLPTWHLYNSMADILFGRVRERNAECQSGPTVLVRDKRVLCWNN